MNGNLIDDKTDRRTFLTALASSTLVASGCMDGSENESSDEGSMNRSNTGEGDGSPSEEKDSLGLILVGETHHLEDVEADYVVPKGERVQARFSEIDDEDIDQSWVEYSAPSEDRFDIADSMVIGFEEEGSYEVVGGAELDSGEGLEDELEVKSVIPLGVSFSSPEFVEIGDSALVEVEASGTDLEGNMELHRSDGTSERIGRIRDLDISPENEGEYELDVNVSSLLGEDQFSQTVIGIDIEKHLERRQEALQFTTDPTSNLEYYNTGLINTLTEEELGSEIEHVPEFHLRGVTSYGDSRGFLRLRKYEEIEDKQGLEPEDIWTGARGDIEDKREYMGRDVWETGAHPRHEVAIDTENGYLISGIDAVEQVIDFIDEGGRDDTVKETSSYSNWYSEEGFPDRVVIAEASDQEKPVTSMSDETGEYRTMDTQILDVDSGEIIHFVHDLGTERIEGRGNVEYIDQIDKQSRNYEELLSESNLTELF